MINIGTLDKRISIIEMKEQKMNTIYWKQSRMYY